MNLTRVAAVAVNAQAALHVLNTAARQIGVTDVIAVQREVHRARLLVCAEHFVAAVAANDKAFTTEPELA